MSGIGSSNVAALPVAGSVAPSVQAPQVPPAPGTNADLVGVLQQLAVSLQQLTGALQSYMASSASIGGAPGVAAPQAASGADLATASTAPTPPPASSGQGDAVSAGGGAGCGCGGMHDAAGGASGAVGAVGGAKGAPALSTGSTGAAAAPEATRSGKGRRKHSRKGRGGAAGARAGSSKLPMAGASAAGTQPPTDLKGMIRWAAAQYGAKAEGLVRVANAESGFRVSVANNWDSNAMKGTPSKGLFQFIEPTFDSMAPKARAANPRAWAGIGKLDWMDPKQQALTAAWAFSTGQGSHWATQRHYTAA